MPYDPSQIAENIAGFEDEETQKGRPTGQATGGRSFEAILASNLSSFITQIADELGVQPLLIWGETDDGKILKDEIYVSLNNNNRSIIWNFPKLKVHNLARSNSTTVRYSWLARKYDVSLWYNPALGALTQRGWVPIPEDVTEFCAEKYPKYMKAHRSLLMEQLRWLSRMSWDARYLSKSSRRNRLTGSVWTGMLMSVFHTKTLSISS